MEELLKQILSEVKEIKNGQKLLKQNLEQQKKEIFVSIENTTNRIVNAIELESSYKKYEQVTYYDNRLNELEKRIFALEKKFLIDNYKEDRQEKSLKTGDNTDV